MKNEAKFRRTCVEPFLKSIKNTYSISIQQTAIGGDADKILCIHGLFISLEIKASHGVESDLQKWKRMQIIGRGKGIAMVVYPENWEEVKIFLRDLSEGINDTDKLFDIMQSEFCRFSKKTS